MVRQRFTSRRAYLSAVAAGTAALAGCSSGGSGSDGSDGSSGGTDGSSGGSDGSDGSSGSGGTTTAKEPTSISFATTETGSVGVLTTIIQQEGLDDEHGISLEIQGAPPPKAMQLLKNDAVETSLFSPQGAAVANTQGSKIRLFGPILANHTSLMTTPDSDVQGWDDLKGKRVGILSPPSAMWNHTNLLLAETGYSMDDFDFRKGSPGAIHSFNQRGDVAAHIHFVPVTIKAIASGEMREAAFLPDQFREAFGHNLQFVPLAAHQSWIDENPESARKLRAALIDAQKLFADSPEETISKYQDVIGLENQKQVDAAVERMPATYPAKWGQSEKENVVNQLELSKKHGIIPDDAPTDIVADL